MLFANLINIYIYIYSTYIYQDIFPNIWHPLFLLQTQLGEQQLELFSRLIFDTLLLIVLFLCECEHSHWRTHCTIFVVVVSASKAGLVRFWRAEMIFKQNCLLNNKLYSNRFERGCLPSCCLPQVEDSGRLCESLANVKWAALFLACAQTRPESPSD